MHGDVVFRVYWVGAGRTGDVYFGTFRTQAEAHADIATLSARETHGDNWARPYHDGGFVVREVLVETDFEIPSQPKPRDAWAGIQWIDENSDTWNITVAKHAWD